VSRRPRASGYFRTGYAQDLALIQSRTERVALALFLVALALFPFEPSAGLTRDEREDLARFILRIKHDMKLAMVWIEHDMQMVADLADRIHVLNFGRTIASGPPDSVLHDRAVIDAYLGPGRAT
jgi:branched-chain amino acid transport system ATP-binding protein